ncbi:MAG: methylmalonyl-CoA epimerase [Chloroflexi bacterium]|nr:methylmalonyl-CoA epimerase [Chloroflexota bacterium]
MATQRQVCTARHLDHIGIAVKDIEETLRFYQEVFGVGTTNIEDLPDQGVRACLIPVGRSHLELIQPTDPNGGVARFIERRGEGLHHICFEVDNIREKLGILKARGLELIDQEPRRGLAGTIAFLHPRATRGVLIELVQK